MSVKVLKWVVSGREDGLKLLDFLKGKLGEKGSNKELKRKIESNLCQLNGQVERFASKAVSKNDQVLFFDEPLKKELDLSFEKQRVLFEDDSYLVYNKPPGLTCDANGLKILKQPKLILTHRLDKETTGALIFAKTRKAAELMERSFKKRLIKKTYLALVDGIPKKKSGKIQNFLGKIKSYQGNAIYGSVDNSAEAQLAITVWALKKKGKGISLIACSPLTGRTHQIRIHLSELGFPILGDYTYGKTFSTKYRPERVLLHAYKIQFKHPVTDEEMEITAPLPEDFREAERQLL